MISEEHSDAVFHHAAVGLVLSDVEGRIINVNKAFCELTGYARAAFIGRLHSDFVHPDFKTPTPDFKRLIDGEIDSYDREKLYVRKDGASVWALVTVSLQKDVTGEKARTIRTINVIRDITEQKSLQEKLRESETRYKAIVESQTEMVCRFQPDGTILFVNGAYARARGTRPEKLVGVNFWDFIKEEDRSDVRSMLDRIRPESPEVQIENRFETSEGVQWTLWANRGLTFDSDGRATELQSSGIDITDRKLAEQALQESEAQFRETFANAAVGIATIGPDRRWMKINSRFCEIVGYREDELLGRDVFDITFEEDRKTPEQTLAISRGEATHAEMEHRYVHRDGHIVWTKTTSSVQRDSEGRILHWISVVEDITDRKHAEMRLAAEHSVSQVIAIARTMDEAATQILQALCDSLDVDIGELWMPDGDGQSIFCSQISISDSVELDDQWGALTSTVRFKIGEGLPGMVWQSRSPQWLLDITGGPPSPRKDLSAACGIASNMAFPLMAGDECMGVICLYSRRRLTVDDVLEGSLASLGRDIGQFLLRVRAEDALTENEERLRLAADAGGIGIWDYDVISGRIRWSDRLERIYGLQAGEFDGRFKTYVSLLHPDDRDQVLSVIESARNDSSEYTTEHRIIRPDGELRWINGHGSTQCDASGQLVRIFGTAMDITDRKRREEGQRFLADAGYILASSLDLDETLRRVASVAVPSPADWCTVDLLEPDGLIRRVAVAHKDPAMVDRAWEITDSYPPGESSVVQKAIETREPVLIPHLTDEFLSQTARNESYIRILRELGLRSAIVAPLVVGEEVHGALTLIAAESGRIYDSEDLPMAKEFGYRCALAISNARLYKVLSESEERFRVTFENAAAGAAHVSLDGTFLRVNQKLCDILGYENSELLNKTSPGITHPEDLPTDQSYAQRLLKGEVKEYTIEKRYFRGDGTPVWVSLTRSLARKADGSPDYFIAVIIDISLQKELEETLRQANETLEKRVSERTAELEAQTESLRLLTARLSRAEQSERRRIAELIHDDLQQLLIAARMQVNISRASVKDGQPVSSLNFAISLLDQAVEQARSLTTQLRPPALYESGLAASLGWLAGWMKQAHHFEVDLDLNASTDDLLEQDAVLLFDSVRELLLNAVKHSGADKARIVVSETDGKRLLISVSDKGKGFDVSALDAPRIEDGGLGLFGIRERIAVSGGRFEAHSSPGEGATFNLIWPITSAPAVEPGDEELLERERSSDGHSGAARHVPGQISVLLVDDHALVRQSLAEVMGKQKDIFVTAEASDGEQAIEAVELYRPNVVVMDVNLPKLNGVQATRVISDRHPDVRIVGISVHSDTATRKAMLDAGASAYVSKDGPVETLLATIRAQANLGHESLPELPPRT